MLSHRLPLVFAACVAAQVALAQPAPAPIVRIRQRYEYIQNPGTKLRKLDLTAPEGADAETIAYFEGNRLRKLVRRGLAAGDPVQQYFFWNDQLIFVHDSRPPDSRLEAPPRQNRFYFDRGRLIRWVDASGNPVQPGTGDYRRYERDFNRAGAYWVRALRGGKFRGVSSSDSDTVNVSAP